MKSRMMSSPQMSAAPVFTMVSGDALTIHHKA